MNGRRTFEYGPADIELSDLDCQPMGAGMAVLSATLTVDRTSSETIQGIQVFINGAAAAGIPTEQGSPTTTPGGVIRHTYSWSNTVMCGQTYNVKAVLTIIHTITIDSNDDTITCPNCQGP